MTEKTPKDVIAPPTFATTSIYNLVQPEMFPGLPALAGRLGIEPNSKSSGGLIVIMKDGRKYDVFEIVNAVLDRLDAAAPK